MPNSRLGQVAVVACTLLKTTLACRNLGQAGHTSISHPHAQFPKGYDIEDVVVANYCYRQHNTSCPTCHTLGLLEYSCSFCIENTCEQETCGNRWDWINNLEECRQRIVLDETYKVNLDRLSMKFNAMVEANVEKFHAMDYDYGSTVQESANVVQMSASPHDGKLPTANLEMRLYCQNQTAEMRDLRCYLPCPAENYRQYGTRCFSNCRISPKDELSSFCIEPEVRTPIELSSSCAEDCNENNIHDFCFACPQGMKKKDCQCIKQEKIYWRDVYTRENRPAIMLLID